MDTRRSRIPILLAFLALTTWGCGGAPGAESPEEEAAADSAPAAEETQTATADAPSGETAAPQPAAGERARTPSRQRPSGEAAARPAEEPPSPTVRATLSAGTEFPVTMNDSLDTRRLEAGRRFTATVTQPVATDTRVVIPSGSEVIGRVTQVRQPRADSVGLVVLAVDSVRVRGTLVAVAASVVDAEVESRSEMTDEGAKIGGGAAAGAIIGAIAGKDVKSAIIGAAGGAAAGTAIAMGTKNRYGVLPQGAVVRLRLDEPLTLTVPR